MKGKLVQKWGEIQGLIFLIWKTYESLKTDLIYGSCVLAIATKYILR